MAASGAGVDAPTWVVDVGNTRTAFGAVEGSGRIGAVFRTATPRRSGDPATLPEWPKPRAIVGIGVVTAAFELWRIACEDAEFPSPDWHGTVDRPLNVVHPYVAPRAPGPDRLAAAHAAWRRVSNAAIVVSAGTALTCDLVGPDGAFLGGAIAPGFRAAAAGLAAAAPELPPAEAAAIWTYPAHSTEGAVSAGVSAAARGATRELVMRAEAALGRRPALFVTGGDAALAAAYLADRRPEVAPDLVLEGLARLLAAP